MARATVEECGTRPPMARATVEECGTRLDVRDLAREGLLNGDHWSTSWDSMALEVIGSTVSLRYLAADGLTRQGVPLDRTRCALGGSRAWFRCPVSRCGRRVAILYRRGGRFACRRCHGLAYRTQQEAPHDRLLLKAERVWNRLGCDLGDELQKPKWMQWHTFNRLADAADAAYLGSLNTPGIARLLAKFGR